MFPSACHVSHCNFGGILVVCLVSNILKMNSLGAMLVHGSAIKCTKKFEKQQIPFQWKIPSGSCPQSDALQRHRLAASSTASFQCEACSEAGFQRHTDASLFWDANNLAFTTLTSGIFCVLQHNISEKK